MIDLVFSTVEDGNFISMSAVPIDDEGNEVTFDDTEYGKLVLDMNRLITTDVGNYAPNQTVQQNGMDITQLRLVQMKV